ncbi:MAG: hypothetical protein GEU93_03645 [Propionibacteriales bacterium]|nr:hypothetical protein [Propionibacteriales bacterium]
MTDLLDRPATGAPSDPSDLPRPLALITALAAAWTAGTGLMLCIAATVAGWFAGASGSVMDAVRIGVDVWLLGQGGGLHAGGTYVGAIPLGLTALSGLMLWRTGRWAASRAGVSDPRGAAIGTAIIGACYAVATTLASLVAATEALSVSPIRAFFAGVVVGSLFGGAGVWSGSSSRAREVLARVPEGVRAAVYGAVASVLAVIAVGAIVVSVSLALDFGAAATAAESLRAGVVGGVLLTLAAVLVLPNASLLAVSFVLGPGFSFGTDTAVAPSGVELGRVPAFPLLAALPGEGAPPWWVAGLVGVPVLAGGLAAVVALRRYPVYGWDRAALAGGGAGLLGGVITGALTGLAGGSVGPGRMADVGADVWECLPSAAAAMGLGGLVGGLLVCWWIRRTR